VRSDRERLLDIAESIDRIFRYTARGRSAFERDELVQTWIIHHLEILGEAAARLPPALLSEHPDVPWALISGLRNVLVHDYFGLDRDLMWATVERDLPDVRRKIEAILRELS
jgi:uncharacterized protein with HEPN domain